MVAHIGHLGLVFNPPLPLDYPRRHHQLIYIIGYGLRAEAIELVFALSMPQYENAPN